MAQATRPSVNHDADSALLEQHGLGRLLIVDLVHHLYSGTPLT